MRMAHETGAKHLLVYSDSQLVVKQVEGTYEERGKYDPIPTTNRGLKDQVSSLLNHSNLEKKTPRQIPSQNLQVALRIAEQDTSPYTTSLRPGPPRSPAHSHRGRLENSYNQMDRRMITLGESMGSCQAQDTSHPFPNVGACPLQEVLYTPSVQMFVHGGKDSHSTGIHSGCYGAHVGTRILANKALRAGYFWPTIKQDAIRLVSKCERCQKHSSLIHQPAEPLTTMLSPCLFMQWGIDIVRHFPLAAGQRKFLLVAIDYFTKWVQEEPLTRITEREVMKFI
ncbi:UNVERIFIED_CONTAM: hypothetical protein Sradi_5613900 [Sesamum radiatum]|uniref:Integrase catalytic domain-containing protein n=1 Tax=Sesamum radiatum TaxID=300843 RepID=A0AAW2L2D4_SESRA